MSARFRLCIQHEYNHIEGKLFIDKISGIRKQLIKSKLNNLIKVYGTNSEGEYVFGYLKDQGKSILFSTHITSDLDKFADSIIYIHAGNLATSDNLKNFLQTAASQNLGNNLEEIMVNYETEDFHEKLTH